MPTATEIRRSMALDIASKCSDLGDERAVMRTLQGLGWAMADIVTHSDSAIEEARKHVARDAVPQ